MKRKFSLLINISVICLCICALAIGVYSATSATLTVSGQIGFTAHNCELQVDITKQGYADPQDLTKYITTAEPVDLDSKTQATTGKLGGNDATFNGNVDLGTMNFTDLAEDTIPPIIVKITVTNKSAYPVSGFVMVDVPENSNIIYTRQYTQLYDDNAEHENSKKDVLHESAVILGAKETEQDTVTFTITFKVGSPDQSIDPSKIIKITGDFAKYDSSKVTTINDSTNNLKYTIKNKDTSPYYTVKPISKKVLTEVTIPASYNHIPVTQIEISAFQSDTTITSIKIPDTVTSIGNSAFYECTNLISVKMPNTIKTIGNYAFYYCRKLTEIFIPSSVQSIDDKAFAYCSGLTKVNTPSLESWRNIDFADYDSTPVQYSKNLYINNVLLTKLTFPADLTEIKNHTFRGCKTITGELNIPNGVTSIGSGAFSGCSGLTGELNIPNGVTSIGSSTFENCSGLTGEITIPDGVTSIGESAFANCENLTGLEIPESVTTIGQRAFYYCRLLTGNLIIPNGVTSIERVTFFNCGFNGTLTIPNGVTNIGESAFSGCDFTGELTIPNSVTAIGKSAFSGCNISSLTISNKVTKILYGTFDRCNYLREVIIPEGVTSIAESAFHSNRHLLKVTIPSSVTSIGTDAFAMCYRLVEPINKSSLVINPGDTTNGDLGEYALKVISDKSQSKITIDDGYVIYDGNTLVDYVGNEQILTLPDCITKINQFAFYENYNIIKVTIPKDVAEIGNYAFQYCSRLVELVDNSTALSVSKGSSSNGYVAYYAKQVITDEKDSKIKIEGDYIFYENNSTSKTLMEYTGNESQIILPNNITEIAHYVFRGNNNLISITLPQNLTTIGSYVLYYCINLKQIVIPNNVKTIGNYSFSDCYKLNDVTIGSSVTSLGQYAFAHCYNLIDIVIPNSVSSIGDYSFQNCDKLKTVSFGTGFSTMGNNAFYDCNELEEVTFNRATPPTFAYSAFTNCLKLTKVYVPNESAVTAYKKASNFSSHYNKVQVKQEA